eukprot:TRINITY_DN24156_c0_g2_i1.p1 TRINITY_DN24156_c0_g2~~TRINITY_DN24156_c0_g2_i1.p1  ORF type:complete len:428 (-),score=57.10 TRINITY_DN24156_c0_g2_i1:361-1530(-)
MCGRGACALGGARYRSAVERRLHRGAKTACLHEATRTDVAATPSKCESVNVAFPGETLFSENFNVGPGQRFPVLRADGGENLELVDSRWGFAAFGKQGQYVINARSETVTEKPLFKKHLQNRCVLFLSGFYEWHQEGKGKQPYFIRTKDCGSPEDVMAIACLMDTNSKSDTCKSAFAVLTAESSPEFAWCHDRQPIILPSASAIFQWLLGPSFAACSDLLGSSSMLQWHKVHPKVGSIRNNGPECIEVYVEAKPSSQPKQSSLASWVSKKSRATTDSGLPKSSGTVGKDGLLEPPLKRPRAGAGSDAADAAAEELVQCPICGQRMAATEIERHANDCGDAGGSGKSTATFAQVELGCREQEVACPICSKLFPVSLAQRHANECADAAGV